MNSRLIFAASGKLHPQVSWVSHTDTEWVYFGAGHEVDHDIVRDIVSSHFQYPLLRLCWTRQGSFELDKTDFFAATKEILGYHDFIVWDSSFDQAIEFNKIGVLRYGNVSK